MEGGWRCDRRRRDRMRGGSWHLPLRGRSDTSGDPRPAVVTVLPGSVQADDERLPTEPTFGVNVDIALSSLVSLGDGHLQKMADSLHILATSEAAQSGNWDRIREPYAELATGNVSALNWFARPDGSYWSLQSGKEAGDLAHRDYFPKVLAGETVMGDLLLSTATGKPMAIVAVPVVDADQAVVGVLGVTGHWRPKPSRCFCVRKPTGIDHSTSAQNAVGVTIRVRSMCLRCKRPARRSPVTR